jgi:hypothetical protein
VVTDADTDRTLKLLVSLLDTTVDPADQTNILVKLLKTSDNKRALSILLSLGMNPDIRDRYQSTALHHAAFGLRSASCFVLMECGASNNLMNINYSNGYPVYYLPADHGGDPQIVKLRSALVTTSFTYL